MCDYKKILTENSMQAFLFSSKIGLEKENHRVNPLGFLSKQPHPSALFMREENHYIKTDFAETQMEFITPPFSTEKEALLFLEAEHYAAILALENDDLLWHASMPPDLPHRDEEIPLSQLNDTQEVDYRKYLVQKYGKRKQMMSGIHVNFELGEDFLKQLYTLLHAKTSLKEFSNEVYMKIARQYLRYEWLLTYLLGASTRAFSGFFRNGESLPRAVRSIRNSMFGYRNFNEVKVRFTSLDTYVKDLQKMIAEKKLIGEREFYSPVRLRSGKKAFELQLNGIQYIELRNIDIVPFQPFGISYATLRFLHLFLLFLLWKPEENPELAQQDGLEKNYTVAFESPQDKTVLYDEGKRLFQEWQEFPLSAADKKIIQEFERMLDFPEETPSGKMEMYQKFDPEFILRFSKTNHKMSIEKAGQLPKNWQQVVEGIQQNLDLSTLKERRDTIK
ncbi:Gamma-glutamylcysteine synthetase [Pilibacter termitis]|uniref:Glutamate--cysteine ligase n=1 Tax=Pilibacter termitis TaxID=263852 RepID=A0A1T4P5H7_9ENTE|nr:hypothetical protein [Pilibacter termitis]SJZ86754.1 Gamma-glutamylcysteine synthetase [Pilibacter termitis]